MKYDYDLVVIGGGAAGLVAATGGAALGAKTALIEKNKLGGDCTWYGCVPSKTLLKSAQIISLFKRSADFGIKGPAKGSYDVSGVMPHVRKIRNKVSAHHPPEVFEKRGIKVIFGAPEFIDNKTVKVNKSKITSKRFIICTGSRPLVPSIDGLMETGYFTNETIFDLDTLPKSIAVLGGGPIGIELAQALNRLGVEVSIIEMMDRILFREDKEAASALSKVLIKEGIKIFTGKKAVKFAKDERGIVISLEDKDRVLSSIRAEKALIAIGRAPSLEGLALENAGVRTNKKGVGVNEFLQTSKNNIYACGDIAGPYQFSHMAEYQAIIALGNALFPFKRKVDYSSVPWCTFTDPELAHLGLTEEEAKKQYSGVKVYKSSYAANDRAVTDIEENGFAKVVCDRRGRILGAHIVGSQAGELLHEYVLAKSMKLGLGKLASPIHIYPTLAQIVKRTGEAPLTEILASKWFSRFSKLMLKLLR
ncbi:MAG: FAD-dependent oxidoreductase [Omnitrophica bacterium]|nr:FAD-dependent oxidoreductase [Candidatus Omnitrophota bacterium]